MEQNSDRWLQFPVKVDVLKFQTFSIRGSSGSLNQPKPTPVVPSTQRETEKCECESVRAKKKKKRRKKQKERKGKWETEGRGDEGGHGAGERSRIRLFDKLLGLHRKMECFVLCGFLPFLCVLVD